MSAFFLKKKEMFLCVFVMSQLVSRLLHVCGEHAVLTIQVSIFFFLLLRLFLIDTFQGFYIASIIFGVSKRP